jgi:ketosteroid isomerase-like protein
MHRLFSLSAVIVSVFLVQRTDGQSIKLNSKEMQVRKSAQEFLAAFDSLNWQLFRSFFAADATVFFPPSANIPMRVEGKTAIEKVFENVFANARKQSSGPRYLKINPLDTRVQMLGNVAVVTFHLQDPGMFGRRTLVLQRFGKRWLIVHLHASGVPR